MIPKQPEQSIIVYRDPIRSFNDILLIVKQQNKDELSFKVGRLVFDTYQEGEISNPTIQLSKRDAQEIMDALWSFGIRPSEYSSENYIQSVEKKYSDIKDLLVRQMDLTETLINDKSITR